MALTKIPGDLIETGAITGDVLADGGIATAKLANDAVTTDKVLDANITHAKLHATMDLTGKTVTVATAAGSTNTTAAASTAFVQQELTTLIGGAPGTLDTLNELAAAINDDANYNSTLTTALATKLPLAGGTLTGDTAIIKSGNPSFTVKTTGAGNNPFIRIQAATNYWDIQSLFSNADDELDFRYNGTSKLEIDNSGNAAFAGNVGIGTTPVTHYTGYEALDIGNTLSLMSNNTSTNISTLTNNGYLNSNASNWIRKVADESTMYEQVSGQHRFKTAASGSAGGAITWSEKVRITADGDVGIGHSSPKSKLSIVSDGSLNTYSGTIGIENTASDKWASITLTDDIDATTASSNYYLIGRGSTYGQRYMSFHIPTASNYGSGSQPKFVFASTGADELFTVEASTGDAYHKGTISIGTTSVSSSYGKLTVAGTGISITPDTSAKMQIGRYNAANPYSYIKAGSTSSGFKFTNAADSIDLLTIDSSGMSVPLVTTNDIKATGAGGVSIQTDEGTKRIEIFDNGKIAFNNLIYQSGLNKNTINSGYDNDADDSDIWINYRGYNDGHTRYRDFRIGDGRSNAIAFFDGSEMTANIHTLKVHTGSFRAVGSLGSTNGMGLTGVGLGQLSNYAHAQFSGSAGGYIDFAEPNVDWSGRIIYTHSNDSMVFYSNAQPTMYLTQTGATVRNGPNANQGKLTFSTQATGYNVIGGNYWGYLGLNSAGHVRIGTAAGETVRIHSSNSTGLFAVGLIGVSGVNASAAVHGLSGDAALVVTNTNLADSSGAYGWTGRGGRYLTSNGTNWTSDGKDPGLVIGSSDGSTQRRNLGIVLHNENQNDSNFSPGIFFGNRANSGNYNTGYAYIMGRKTGQGVDTNWSTGEIHMDTAGSRTGTTSRTQYVDDNPAFKIDNAGDVTMPYKAYAYGTINGNPSNPTNNYGIALTTTRYQNCTPTTNGTHGPGITITKAGFYILNMSFLYDPLSHNYVYSGWCVNGSQIHHWHSNHTVGNNHDAVSQIGRYLNIGDHVSIENSNATISTIYGNAHSAWYIAKIG